MASISGRSLPRRRLAAGAALLGLAGAGAETPADAASPDAELIENCAAYDALERQFLATDFDHPAGSTAEAAAIAERERFTAAQEPHLDAICASRPTTLAGYQALANTLVSVDFKLLQQNAARGCLFDRMLLALLGGLTGQA